MNIAESIRTALSSVLGNKLRALLTMLGIIIGISSVITIVSLGAGMSGFMEDQFVAMGMGNLQVTQANWAETFTEADQLLMSDAEMLLHIPGVRDTSPRLSSWNFEIRLPDTADTLSTNLQGVFPNHAVLQHTNILYGRYINNADIDNAAPFAIIQDTTAEVIFGFYGPELIGQVLELSSWSAQGIQRFTIAGIAADPQADFTRMNPEWVSHNVYVPLPTLQRIYGTNHVDTVIVAVHDPNEMTEIAGLVSFALDSSRGTEGNYNVFNPMNFIEQANAQLAMITLAISGIAAISLLVGGIGVMNIMLVTVTERTREIGIRKAIGARNRDILVQFLIESSILTFIGGSIGIGLGSVAGGLIGPLMDITPIVSPLSVVIAAGASCSIGIIFGVGPANKASRLDPIEALRYE